MCNVALAQYRETQVLALDVDDGVSASNAAVSPLFLSDHRSDLSLSISYTKVSLEITCSTLEAESSKLIISWWQRNPTPSCIPTQALAQSYQDVCDETLLFDC